jgi:hypothetical protein
MYERKNHKGNGLIIVDLNVMLYIKVSYKEIQLIECQSKIITLIFRSLASFFTALYGPK